MATPSQRIVRPYPSCGTPTNFAHHGNEEASFRLGPRPSPGSKDHCALFIGGKWVKPKSGHYFDTINPANEQKIARIAEANAADVDAALKAARMAYDTVWSRMPAAELANYHLPHHTFAA